LSNVKTYYSMSGLKNLNCNFDVVLLSTKSYHTVRITNDTFPYIGKRTTVSQY